ncbi:MAG: anhydro-N-acetylmuramic acid kinase [Pseudomonadota bacterium]
MSDFSATEQLGLEGDVMSVGAMSGTSLDGVDAAVVCTDGCDIRAFGPTAYRAYSTKERAALAAALGHWSGSAVTAASDVVQSAHLAVLARFSDVDVIGFHGQTLAHDPHHRRTLQVGDGARLAEGLGTSVVWDFRTADVVAGGEGAPLAPFFHHACARFAGLSQPVCFLNLGGVGNVTWVDPACQEPQMPGALCAFDTGPANAPINDLMQARRGIAFDENGALAAAGVPHQRVIDPVLSHPYFAGRPPKSLDRDAFAQILCEVASLQDADAAATLTALCAQSVAAGLRHCPQAPDQILVTGGGRHNQTLMMMLQDLLSCPVRPVEAIGLNGDMLEAQAFAYLAVRVLRGLPTSSPQTTGTPRAICGGRISVPSNHPGTGA